MRIELGSLEEQCAPSLQSFTAFFYTTVKISICPTRVFLISFLKCVLKMIF